MSAINRKSEHATFQDVREDARELKDDTIEAVGHAAGKGVDAVRHRAEHAMDRTRDSGRRAADSANAAHQRFCDYVCEHPTASVLIAFGIGALASRFIPRR